MNYKVIVLIVFLIPNFALSDTDKIMAHVEQLFSHGKCDQVLRELENKDFGKRSRLAKQYYLMGKCYNHFFESKNAVLSLKKSKANGCLEEDLDYEIGLSLFRLTKYKEAIQFFKKSKDIPTQRGLSTFYIGKSYFWLKNYESAKAIFLEAGRDKSNRLSLRQESIYFAGDTILKRFERSYVRDKAIQSYVLPLYNEAIAISPKSKFVEEINKAIRRLK